MSVVGFDPVIDVRRRTRGANCRAEKKDDERKMRSPTTQAALLLLLHLLLLLDMASLAIPAVHSAWASTLSTRGTTTSNAAQRASVKFIFARTWPSQVSGRRPLVSAEYRRGGGAGDFVAGFLLGGAVFGALGYLLAPQITKTLSEADNVKEEDESPVKKPARFLDDDEGLEKTRKNLNEKIAQLNTAIDDVSAQLRSEDGFGVPNENSVELESAA